jgi:hypothetical protein
MATKIPSNFKYKLRSGQKEYRRDPPGAIDVSAMIANKPYWVSPTPKCIDKQKTLVLADWTASTWPEEKMEQVRTALGELIDQEFTIYRWSNGLLTPLDKTHLSSNSFHEDCKAMTLASEEEITKTAVTQNKLTRDEVQVVDDYWLNHLLSGKEEPEPRIVRTSQLPDLTREQTTTLVKVLNSSRPKLEKIIHDTFSEKSNKKAKILKDKLAAIPLECDYTSASMQYTGEDVFTEIHMNEFTLNNNQLKNLSAINFGESCSIEYIQSTLKATANLKTIDLKNCKNLADQLNLDGINLSALETIDLSCSKISMPNLQALLKAAPKLKTIDLSSCKNLAGSLNLDGINLAALETIDLSDSNISAPNLQALLKAAPKLKTINLSECRVLFGPLNLDGISLAALETINVSESNLSAQSLQEIKKAAPMANIQGSPHEKRAEFQSDATPTDQKHDPKKMKEFKPSNEPFQFKNINKTKNQGMIIEKLCHYLTLTKQHLDIIPKLQDGICNALSHFFSNRSKSQWDGFISLALDWNGEANTLSDDLSSHFNCLYADIQKYQLGSQSTTQYLGDGLQLFLSSLANRNTNQSYILYNPWHAIAIKPNGDGSWAVYDPNYVNGYRVVWGEEFLKTIHTAIGQIVSIESDKAIPYCEIKNPNDFIAQGGLLALCKNDNKANMLSKLPKDYPYTKEALDGILLRSTAGNQLGLTDWRAQIL